MSGEPITKELVTELMSPAQLAPAEDVAYNALRANLKSRRWRLQNLYFIIDKKGNKVKFKMNLAQRTLIDNMWYFNIILKARQLGFTTFLCILFLDTALFRPNTHCGIIAHNREDAEEFFSNKVRFAYENLPTMIKEGMKAPTDSTRKLAFSNGSSIRVGTSLRSGTFYMLHISEFGKVCARYPDKAKEIVTGAINTVHAGQFVFIESTAEGRAGYFYEFCMAAMKRMLMGKKLNPLQFRFHFFPWWRDPDYVMNEQQIINQEMVRYFDELEAQGIKLTRKQQNWYIAKQETQGDDMLREYPSTPKEAFQASVIGAYFTQQMTRMRKEKRICSVLHDSFHPVNVFWDIGYNDAMALWFHQRVGVENRLIRYFEASGEGLQYYVDYLNKLPYIYGTHYMPHDGRNHSPQTGKSFRDYAISLGLRNIRIIHRAKNKEEVIQGIQASRNFLDQTRVDEELCDAGIKVLDNYRKEWDKNTVSFKETPLHDWSCLPAGVNINTPTGPQPVESFIAGDRVKIGDTVANITHAQQVGEKEIIEVTLSNRVTVRCSAEHKIFTSEGLIQARHIEPSMVLLTEKDMTPWLQSSKGMREAFIESFKGSSTDSGRQEGCMLVRSVENRNFSTESCGSQITGPYLSDMLSCLWMETGMISQPETGSVDIMPLMVSNMKHSIMDKSSMELCFDSSLKQDIMGQNIMEPRPSCSDMFGSITTGRSLMEKLSTTLTTIKQTIKSKISAASHPQSTPNITQGLKVLSVKRCPVEPVFDIEVAHHHAYVLSDSGVVTSNSNGADSLRCGAVGFKELIEAMQKDLLPEYAEDI